VDFTAGLGGPCVVALDPVPFIKNQVVEVLAVEQELNVLGREHFVGCNHDVVLLAPSLELAALLLPGLHVGRVELQEAQAWGPLFYFGAPRNEDG
jgi:hypothetical protein